jgi:YHS domain-containing protein
VKILIALMLLVGLAGCGKKEDCCAIQPTIVGEKAKDPICGMWVAKTEKAIKAEFDNADYFFCAEECKAQFLKNPTKFVTACDCKNFKHDCKCEHCSGKRVPCDCK